MSDLPSCDSLSLMKAHEPSRFVSYSGIMLARSKSRLVEQPSARGSNEPVSVGGRHRRVGFEGRGARVRFRAQSAWVCPRAQNHVF